MAPEEDTDMDLVADKLVLLSLPVTQRQFTAELDKIISNGSFSIMLTSCQALCFAHVFSRYVFQSSVSLQFAGAPAVPDNREYIN